MRFTSLLFASRKCLLIALLFVLLCWNCDSTSHAAAPQGAEQTKDRPNVVFILADDK